MEGFKKRTRSNCRATRAPADFYPLRMTKECGRTESGRFYRDILLRVLLAADSVNDVQSFVFAPDNVRKITAPPP